MFLSFLRTIYVILLTVTETKIVNSKIYLSRILLNFVFSFFRDTFISKLDRDKSNYLFLLNLFLSLIKYYISK